MFLSILPEVNAFIVLIHIWSEDVDQILSQDETLAAVVIAGNHILVCRGDIIIFKCNSFTFDKLMLKLPGVLNVLQFIKSECSWEISNHSIYISECGRWTTATNRKT